MPTKITEKTPNLAIRYKNYQKNFELVIFALVAGVKRQKFQTN